VAEYRLTRPKDDEWRLRFVYSAPDQLKLQITHGEGAMVNIISDGVMTMHSLDEERGEAFVRAAVLPIPPDVVAKVLDSARDLFPEARIEDPADRMEVYAGFDLTRDADGEPRIGYELGTMWDRPALLRWLPFLQHEAHFVSTDAATLVFECEDWGRIVLQEHTGFLESAHVRWSGGEKSLQLIKLEVDGAIEDEEFQAPQPTSKARDESAGVINAMVWREAIEMRRNIVAAIGGISRKDESTWNSEAKAKSRQALETLHSSILDLNFSAWVDRTVPNIDAFCWWFQSMLVRAGEDAEKLADLEHQVAERERAIRKDLDSARESCQALMFPEGETPKSQFWTDLRDIDRAAWDAAFSARVEGLMIGRFTERIALAREGKLTDPNEGKGPRPADH
jgi:hypothetical protein